VLDPVAMKELLGVVGDVTVGSQKVTAANSLRVLLHEQYRSFDTTGKNTARRDFLADVVQQVFAQLNAGSGSPQAVGSALADAAAGRHLLAWASNTRVQRAWSAVGMDGVLPDQSVAFALQNRGGNKLDYFQTISAIATATLSRSGTDITMRFSIANSVPPGEPAYVAGQADPRRVNKPGVYVGIASINVPANATRVRLTGGDYDLVSGPDGNTQVVSQWLHIDPGAARRLTLSFHLPPGPRALAIVPSGRQPAILWHLRNAAWRDTRTQLITW
jgi:hypothetical protein